MISALVLTLNEERDLPRCLKSLTWCDDVVVLDSGSSDATRSIAEHYGARVVVRPFDDWSSHMNWALDTISFKYEWIYNCDADEVVPEDLRDELLSVARNPVDPVAYWIRYRNFFMGRWIKHCGIYPTWVMRFYRIGKVRWQRLVNPDPLINGQAGFLSAHFHHHALSKGLCHWFQKHARYAAWEAEETLRSLRQERVTWRGLFGAAPQRRRTLKQISFRMPCRPLLRFIYMYLLRTGFLDGYPGLLYCRLLASYEFMIVMQVKELRLRERNRPL